MSNSIERVTRLDIDPSIRARISRLQNIEVRGIDPRGVGAFIRRARVESRPVVCRGNLCNRRYTGLVGGWGGGGGFLTNTNIADWKLSAGRAILIIMYTTSVA